MAYQAGSPHGHAMFPTLHLVVAQVAGVIGVNNSTGTGGGEEMARNAVFITLDGVGQKRRLSGLMRDEGESQRGHRSNA